jgi:hypothetical protein
MTAAEQAVPTSNMVTTLDSNQLASPAEHSSADVAPGIKEAIVHEAGDTQTCNVHSKSHGGSVQVKALKEFTLFAKLPSELRLRIWKFSLPGPRCLELWYHERYKQYQAPAILPQALQVCNESRQEALKHYKTTFGSLGSPGRIYFDFEVDILLLNCAGLIPEGRDYTYVDTIATFLAKAEGISQIRNLAVCAGFCFLLGAHQNIETEKFTSLKKLVCADDHFRSHRKHLRVEAERPGFVLFKDGEVRMIEARFGVRLCYGKLRDGTQQV